MKGYNGDRILMEGVFDSDDFVKHAPQSMCLRNGEEFNITILSEDQRLQSL